MSNLDSDVKTAWVRQLKDDWKNANHTFFKSKMLLPNIDILNAENTLGRWQGGGFRRTLWINSFLIQNYPWEYVLEVLYHEMAHQYVDEILYIRDAMPHGVHFQRVCRANGIDHTASGELKSWAEKRMGNSKAGQGNHKILDKVHKLLALAESANEHEAQSAMARAHELLLKHNLALLDQEKDWNYVHKQVGELGRKNPIKSLIGSIICQFFFVEAIWTFGYDPYKNTKGRILEIYGTRENVEMAEYVHDYLQNISELLWKNYKEQRKIIGNKHRRTFIYGLLNGFYNKLDTQAEEKRSMSLVWKGDPKLKEYFRRRNPKIRRTTFSYSQSCKDAYDSGISHGKNLVIHKGIHEQGTGENRLLS